MARLILPLFSTEAHGRLAGLAYQGSPHGPRVIRASTSQPRRTESVQSNRQLFAQCRLAWQSLSDAERAAWRAAAPPGLTGFQLFVSRLRLALNVGSDSVQPTDSFTMSGFISTFTPGTIYTGTKMFSTGLTYSGWDPAPCLFYRQPLPYRSARPDASKWSFFYWNPVSDNPDVITVDWPSGVYAIRVDIRYSQSMRLYASASAVIPTVW